MPSHHVIPAAAQHPIIVEATYFASDQEVLKLLVKNNGSICGVVAYHLQYLRQSISIVHKTLSETLRRECQVPLAFTIRTNLEGRPVLDQEFARAAAQDLVGKCPDLARIQFNMRIFGKCSSCHYEHVPSPSGFAPGELETLARGLANLEVTLKPGRA